MSLADQFAAMRPEPAKIGKPMPKESLAPLPLQGTGKRSHPDFAAVKVYLRKDTHKRAKRKFEDAGGDDFSDLVEQLLKEYLGA